jgi:hypothetical protein
MKQVTKQNNMTKTVGTRERERTVAQAAFGQEGHELYITGFGAEKDETMMDRRGQTKF